MGMCVIIYGNPVDGLKAIGPYNNPTEAAEMADGDCRIEGGDWWIMPLEHIAEA